MVNWSELEDSGGAADAVPGLLAEAGSSPDSHAWTYLWTRLSDARGVYSASYAALPFLAAIAKSWPATARSRPLSLAGSIVSWPERAGGVDPFADYAVEIAEMCGLADVSLRSVEIDDATYVNILVAMEYLRGHSIDAGMEHLGRKELQLECPRCGYWNYAALGDPGFFSTLDYDYEENPDARKIRLTAVDGPSLSGLAAELFSRAGSDGRAGVQSMLENYFGDSKCGNCGLVFRMIEHAV